MSLEKKSSREPTAVKRDINQGGSDDPITKTKDNAGDNPVSMQNESSDAGDKSDESTMGIRPLTLAKYVEKALSQDRH